MLPPALLDLTLLRVSNPPNAALRTVARGTPGAMRILRTRFMHQATLASPPPYRPSYNYQPSEGYPEHDVLSRKSRHVMEGGLPVRSGKLAATDISTELERRVRALEAAAETETSVMESPSFTEEELAFLYEDLLALPTEEKTQASDSETTAQAQAQKDQITINAIDQRLIDSQAGDSHTQTPSSSNCHAEEESPQYPTQPYRRVLSRAHDIISSMEAVRSSLVSDANVKPETFVPGGVISPMECESLVRVSIQARDAEAAELALSLMKRSGIPLSENVVTDVLEMYSNEGYVRGVENILATYLTNFPNERQRHLHVKSHIRATPPDTIPTDALAALHSYEAQSKPAPMQTYTYLITSLFTTKTSLGRAQAWDLFSHMRYVAHPDPDATLYTLMIRACASPLSSSRSSEPERALDLWTEMTVDHRIPPTSGAYDAIILACARSGSKVYVNEAFRLAKQMLDSHRDAHGNSAFEPDRRTFCALLEGAKRLGDLSRARWILAQMVNRHRDDDQYSKVEGVNEEVMMHVFHAYASYRPPFQRTIALLVNEGTTTTTVPASGTHATPISNSEVSTREEWEQKDEILTSNETPSFSQIPPQSKSEVIHEAKTLFRRILHDTGRILDQDSESIFPADRRFKDVTLTSRLLNSYLSVYYKHSSLETSKEVFWSLFDDHEVPRTVRTYVEALERCGIAKRGHERNVALEFGSELWAKWQALEDAGEENGRSLSGRMIERAHIAFIRLLTLTGNSDSAVRHVRAFEERYPPSALRKPDVKPALRSTRTALVGERPLVRMTTTAEVPDDHVPPLLMFDDVEVLHHRLVAEGSRKEIGYLKYLCKAYEWALRVRRDDAMKAVAPKGGAAVPNSL